MEKNIAHHNKNKYEFDVVTAFLFRKIEQFQKKGDFYIADVLLSIVYSESENYLSNISIEDHSARNAHWERCLAAFDSETQGPFELMEVGKA